MQQGFPFSHPATLSLYLRSATVKAQGCHAYSECSFPVQCNNICLVSVVLDLSMRQCLFCFALSLLQAWASKCVRPL